MTVPRPCPASAIVIVDPPSGVNVNLPNQDVAFSATILNAPVVDLHAAPWPPGRVERTARRLGAETLLLSRRSFTLGQAERIAHGARGWGGRVEVRDLHGPVDVQCCYPFVRDDHALTVAGAFGDDLPFPDYELFDSFPLLRACWRAGLWAYAIMTSLGCPFGCTFCAARRRKWLPRSAAHAVEELRQARARWRIQRFEVIDDAFNVDRGRVLEFCERVAPLGLRWACTNGLRADLFDEEMARAMARSGCDHVGFGVETMEPEVLAAMNKGLHPGQIEAAVAAARRHIPRVSGFFIVGLPGATEASDRRTLDWAREQGIDGVFSLYLPDSAGSSDAVFYGSGSTPLGDAYDGEAQRRVYLEAKQLKRGRYRSTIIQERLPVRMLEAMARAGALGAANLAAMAGRKLPGMLMRGEIQ